MNAGGSARARVFVIAQLMLNSLLNMPPRRALRTLVDDPAPRTRQRRPNLTRASLPRVEQVPRHSKENRGGLKGGEKPTATTRLGRPFKTPVCAIVQARQTDRA